MLENKELEMCVLVFGCESFVSGQVSCVPHTGCKPFKFSTKVVIFSLERGECSCL